MKFLITQLIINFVSIVDLKWLIHICVVSVGVCVCLCFLCVGVGVGAGDGALHQILIFRLHSSVIFGCLMLICFAAYN